MSHSKFQILNLLSGTFNLSYLTDKTFPNRIPCALVASGCYQILPKSSSTKPNIKDLTSENNIKIRILLVLKNFPYQSCFWN